MNSRENPHTPQQPGSARAARIRRRRRKRIALFASFAVIILLIALAAVLLALEIADASSKLKNNDNNPSDSTSAADTSYGTPGGTSYTAVTGNYNAAEGALVLVNGDHEYLFPPTESRLISVYDSLEKNNLGVYSYKCSFTTVKMDKTALSAFNKMMDAFYTETKNTHALMSDAYRSKTDQEGKSIKPGFSDHHTGYLVSVKFMDESGNIYTSDNSAKYADAYKWLGDHAAEFGFVVRYPNAKSSITGVSDYTYCYRYVGTAHAAYMTDNNLCLEEYISLLKSSYTYAGEHLKLTDKAGTKFEIYYIPSVGDNTAIYVPGASRGYEVSGDNDGGYIVTVALS